MSKRERRGETKNKTLRSSFFILVSRERLELSTPGLKGPCSNQLSYRPTVLVPVNYITSTSFWKPHFFF